MGVLPLLWPSVIAKLFYETRRQECRRGKELQNDIAPVNIRVRERESGGGQLQWYEGGGGLQNSTHLFIVGRMTFFSVHLSSKNYFPFYRVNISIK